MRVHSADLTDAPAVVVAGERMDDNPHWRLVSLVSRGRCLPVGRPAPKAAGQV
ncbi:hypothetical protein [Streptomyces gobitricini]|uniref:Uncharacterized protein n=1 Tax=Streptomyces gobitricini TaxID=68211 RepID=A0ABN3LYB2_9ACTN